MQHLSKLQFMIVDDSAQMRFLLRSLLRAGGGERIAEAETAEEAIAFMRAVDVDLMLVDWCMQPMDGIAFTKALRCGPQSPKPTVAIVMISAHSERSRVEAARDAGVNGFLVKPISTRLLFDRVSAALSDTRPFVRSPTYFGPDRRRGAVSAYLGPFRRESDSLAPREFLLLDAG
jgi:DNA-binding NarL/FixJ family response regulator